MKTLQEELTTTQAQALQMAMLSADTQEKQDKAESERSVCFLVSQCWMMCYVMHVVCFSYVMREVANCHGMRVDVWVTIVAVDVFVSENKWALPGFVQPTGWRRWGSVRYCVM